MPQIPPEYGHTEFNEMCDQVAVEVPPSTVEDQLEPGTQRQYSLNDFELIRYDFVFSYKILCRTSHNQNLMSSVSLTLNLSN